MFYIVGLGNYGEEYINTRHNTGRMAVDTFINRNISEKIKKNIKVLVPDTFMNNSGKYVAKFVKSMKMAQNLIVVYDDIDLALGTIKISYNRSSGGHNGLESIIKSLKTKEFIRIRIGISKATPKGKVRKPKGESDVLNFLLSKFKSTELEILKKAFESTSEAIITIITEGTDRAMNIYN